MDVTSQSIAGGAALNPKELELVGPGEKTYPVASSVDGGVARAEDSVGFAAGYGRGIAVFSVPKDASGFKLRFKPLDLSAGGNVFTAKPLETEQALIDLAK